jgi:hypothetical protein
MKRGGEREHKGKEEEGWIQTDKGGKGSKSEAGREDV